MRIVHYMTGVPPMREGGMIRYAVDLAEVQQENGADVSFLVPGGRKMTSSCAISPSGDYNRISVYSIDNPPLIPMGEGVRNPEDILNRKQVLSSQQLNSFFLSPLTDILHIHTFLGLPHEVVSFCFEKRIRMIYSSHDYFPVCPRVNLIDSSGSICSGHGALKCSYCNRNAPSAMQYKIRSSPLLLKYRQWLNPLRKFKGAFSIPVESEQKDFSRLIRYYRTMFERMDGVHFNSTQTARIYTQTIEPAYSKIIPISHRYLPPRVEAPVHSQGVLRFGFIGDLSYLKGYPLLTDVLKQLSKQCIVPWELHVYGKTMPSDKMHGKILYKGAFTSDQVGSILGSIDLLIVPSQWKETFCFVVQEALAAQTPVLVCSNVGAKDLVESVDPSYLFDDSRSLLEKLLSVAENPDQLVQYRKRIGKTSFNFSFDDHVRQMDIFYHEILERKPSPIYP